MPPPPLSKHSTHSTSKAPNITLLPNGRIPQAPKPGCKTQQCQSKDADKDIGLEPPAPTPAVPHPVLHKKKSGTVSGAAPGADTEDEVFIPPRALQKRIPDCVAEVSDPLVLPLRSASPDANDSDETPLPLQPHRNKTPMHPEKCPVSQESLDEEDEQAVEKEAQVEEAHVQPTKGKKGKDKKSNVEGPFKSGPIPEQAKQCAFAIHTNFEKQIQDLAAEIGKAPQLLFSLAGGAPLLSHHAPTRWGTFKVWYGIHREIKKSKDEKHETYVEDLKLEGTFNKVVGKVQHEYMRLAETAFKYNGVHCFGFIVNLQPSHTGRTGSTMWGATPAFQRMKINEKGVISRQIA
ncbi:hypothetical protein DXG01_016924 [Tephrocybe rancida]|nr:hypothetical protein DXG01_016924 [Tephrocybe rancida]